MVWWAARTSLTAAVRHRLDERRLGWTNRRTASAIGGGGVMTVAIALKTNCRSTRTEMTPMRALGNKPSAVHFDHDLAGSTASQATERHGTGLVYCRQCETWIAVFATRELSTHPTSGGIVTYFRCTAGHADFYRTSTASPGSEHATTQR